MRNVVFSSESEKRFNLSRKDMGSPALQFQNGKNHTLTVNVFTHHTDIQTDANVPTA